jgi:hypothetical protein
MRKRTMFSENRAPYSRGLHSIALALFLLISMGRIQPALAKIPIPASGCYHAAFTPNGQSAFESQAGKNIAFELIFSQLNTTSNFPTYTCDQIVKNGAVAYVACEPWDGDANSTAYTLQSFLDGAHDAAIIRWAT